MSKTDRFKSVFIRNAKLQEKLQARTRSALSDIEEMRTLAETLASPGREQLLAAIDTLEQKVYDQASAGAKNPGKAWAAMDELTAEATKRRGEVMGLTKGANKAPPDQRFSRALEPTLYGLKEARLESREVVNDQQRARLIKTAEDLRDKVDALKKQADPTPTAAHCEQMEQYRKEVGELMREIRGNQGRDPQPGSQRAASRGMLDGIGEIEGLGDRLSDPTKNGRGHTARQEVMGQLEIFDKHFAEDETNDPGARSRNGAMRIAATTRVLADRSARTVNDPYIAPHLGKAMMREYEPELGLMLTNGQDDEDAGKTIKLANAMVMDDPVMKLMTGKLDPIDAVQCIRDMAQVAEVEPSVMFKMLRRQFEMQIGGLNQKEVSQGTKSKDANANGNFDLTTITGELSSGQFGQIAKVGPNGEVLDNPNGPGIALRPGGSQEHVVVAGDTFESLAQDYASDPKKWEAIRKNNMAVMLGDKVEPLDKKNATDPLPVGAVIIVPSKLSILDQLEPYVAAWDDKGDEKEDKGKVDLAKERAPKVQPKDPSLPVAGDAPSGDGAVTPDKLRDAFTKLRSPRNTQRGPDGKPVDPGKQDMSYIQAPGLGQDHAPRTPLDNAPVVPVDQSLSKEQQQQERIKNERAQMPGKINDRQYAHLRLLARSDEEDREGVLAKEGKPVDEAILDLIRKRYGPERVNADTAKKIAKAAADWIGKVPLTITFTADRLFSDPSKNAPTHGTNYTSDVVLTRGQEELGTLVGRDSQKEKGKVGTQGGSKSITGWKERGENYMRWRRDKDDREGRHDVLDYEDQQIFAAANPAFSQAKGGVGTSDGGFGINYYGTAHFLLRDAVRNRCAFIVRAGGSDSKPVQRKNVEMLIYDMVSNPHNGVFLDAMLGIAAGKGPVTAPTLNWEAHLFGGFDMSKDADAIYLPNNLDPKLSQRIEVFARNNSIKFESIGAMPKGLVLQPKADPKKMVLPDL